MHLCRHSLPGCGQVTAVTLPYVETCRIPGLTAGALHVDFSFVLDQLSLVMLLVVTGVGFLIHIYSVGYMHDDEGYARYFSYLNLFLFFMTVLVLAGNFLLHVCRLGGRRPRFLSAHRLLVPEELRRRTPARKHSSSTASATSAS